jgi:acyl-CoA synthetase (AMP-forming)/AMP-acid ligase II
VALPYSSGTTGLPKGVMLTHRNLVANLCQGDEFLVADQDEQVIAVLPLYHIYGLTVLMCGAVWKGATLVTMPRFDLEEFLRLMQDHAITRAFLVPPIVLGLAKSPLVDKYDLSALNTVVSGAAPLDSGLEAAAAQRTGATVTQGWGLTETSPVLTTNLGGEPRPGSVGRLIPNTELRVVDPISGEDLPVGETGELVARGPQVMKGYLGRPEDTAGMLEDDGWLHTGDLGYVDGNGYVYVVDRVKELIKYKGLQVAPAELEAVLLSHPGIADAAVVRAPDEEAGEIPKAFVVTREPLTAEEVMAYVAERVAPFKKVRLVEFIDEIPKAASGKILRRKLAGR